MAYIIVLLMRKAKYISFFLCRPNQNETLQRKKNEARGLRELAAKQRKEEWMDEKATKCDEHA